MLEIIKAIILGIVEGITEFLPISSTGHLIVASDLLNFQGSLGGTFEIFIQLGAILAVIWYYRRDLWSQLRAIWAFVQANRRDLRGLARAVPQEGTVQRFWLNLFIAFLPAAAFGLLFHDWIKAVLFSPVVVAIALVVGGAVLLLVERRDHAGGTSELTDVSPRQALFIGLVQVLALIPGTSRSASSIVGGLLGGLDRRTATAFSFYLAIPTLGLATVYDLLTSLNEISAQDVLLLAVGLAAAFVSALFAIGWLLRYVASHDFRVFGYYRIVAGLAVLAWWFWIK